MYKNLMIDIETLSKKHNASIISIAAIPFDNEFNISKKIFYQNINLDSCLKQGADIETETLTWWIENNHKLLQQMLTKDTMDIGIALIKLNEFIDINLHNDFFIWAKGTTFDLSKLKYYYEIFKISCPWHYKFERCIRTFLHDKNEYSLNIDLNFTNIRNFFSLDNNIILDNHNPIVDCYYQIKVLDKLS